MSAQDQPRPIDPDDVPFDLLEEHPRMPPSTTTPTVISSPTTTSGAARP